jgi:flagellar M-ring protein FliF
VIDVDGLLQTLRGLGPARLAMMGTVGAVMIGFFIYLVARITTPEMGLLYGELKREDTQKIAQLLQISGVNFDLRKDSTEVYVAKDRILPLRIQLAAEGLPSGGSIGYEIFDKTDALGTTNFIQTINQLRALEGELARTIRSIDKVAGARVHLVMPRRELFSRESREPSASIVLRMRKGAALDRTQVQSIQHIVAAAVPDLKPARISIVDDQGNLLARGLEEAHKTGAQIASGFEDFRNGLEARLKRQVETLVEKSVGFGNVRVEIAADLDFDRVTENRESFDPDGQVVRSTQTVNDSSSAQEGDQTVSVQTNIPQTQGERSGSSQTKSQANRTEETTNFEITRTVRNSVREAGDIKRLSVAVLVNGRVRILPDGQKDYQPRPPEELDQIASLVRSAVGFNERRGDEVRVINLRFAEFEDMGAAIEESQFLGLVRKDIFKIAEMLVLAVVAILIVLLVLRPLVRRALQMGQAGAAAAALPPGSQLAADTAAALEAPQAEEDQVEIMIDIEKVEGQVKASSIKKIGQIVDKHPEEALAIIRSWMYQES